MRRWAVVWVALLGLSAQPVPERDLPEGHYCVHQAPPRATERAHVCRCDWVCEQDADGVWTVKEGATCLVYCHHDKCRCHGEVPCPHPA